MGRLKVDGDKEIYFEHFDGTGPTVVLSHGFGMGVRIWDDVVAALRDAGRAVLVYDQRCCGQSDKDFSGVSVESQGSDIVALVAHLNLSSVVVNGWSFGGAVVIDAASKLGDKLAGIVLTGGATPRYTQAEGFPHGGTADDVMGTVAALRANRIDFLHGLYYEGVFVKAVSDETKQVAWQIALQSSPGADASLGALANIDQRSIMQDLDAPALVISGELDGVVPAEISKFAAQTLSNATYLEMSGCGHAPFLEDREAYNSALSDFLNQLA